MVLKLLLLSCLVAAVTSRTYPVFKQCDPQWRNQQLGTSQNTICSAGCLMSSAAMALNAIGKGFNPSTLNSWLTANGGYVSGDLFVWASINVHGVTFLGKQSRSQIKQNINQGNIVILNVHNGAHWVLATGMMDDNNVFINDPNYSTPFYSLDQIVENQVGVYRLGGNQLPSFLEELEMAFNVDGRGDKKVQKVQKVQQIA